MAYTYDQLVLAYKAVRDGIAPDPVAQSSLQGWATLNSAGQMTNAQVISNVINSADSTTAVAVLAYQFFTGKSPTAAGLDYLVNSASNPNDLNDPYYSKFNLENRYINFAANLGVAGAGAANFADKYGSMSYSAFVASIYETIIGSSYAQAVGIDPAAAIASIVSRQAAIQASAGIVAAGQTAAQLDIATKAATVGYLLGEAIKADVGLYAAASNNFMLALIQGAATYNTDITLTYRPTPDTGSHGTTGQAVDRSPATLPDGTVTTPVKPPPIVHNFVLTLGTDHFVGEIFDDTFTGTDQTFTADDVLDGGGGVNTLTITASSGFYSLPSATVSNMGRVIVTNTGGDLSVGSTVSNWTGVTFLSMTSAGGLLASNTPSAVDVSARTTNQGGQSISITGGHNVLVTAAGATTGPIDITNATGDVNITRTDTGVGAAGRINVTGGAHVTITQISANNMGTTQTNGRVTFYGDYTSSTVQVTNAAAATATIGTPGVVANTVTIYDRHTDERSGLGTLTTVNINGFSDATITDNAMTDLRLTNGSGLVQIFNQAAAVGRATSLNLTLDNVSSAFPLSDASVYTTLHATILSSSTIGDLYFPAVTALNIDGLSNLTLNSTSNMTSLRTVTVSASASLNAAFSGGTLTSIDASGSVAASSLNLTSTTGAVAITVNGLANHLRAGTGADVVTITGPSSVSTFTDITGAHAGMKIGFAAHGTEAFNATEVIGPFASVSAGANAAIASLADGSTNGQIAWFRYAGATYIVESQSAAHATFVDGSDFIVKLNSSVNLAGGHAAVSGHYLLLS